MSVAELAQDGAAATARSTPGELPKLLQAAAGVAGAEWQAVWKWPVTVSGSAMTSRSGGMNPEEASGRFDANALLTEFGRGRLGTVAVMKVGRHTVAREGDGPWRLDGLAGVSLRTIEREWAFLRTFLQGRLGAEVDEPQS